METCLLLAAISIIHILRIHREEPDEQQALLVETQRIDDVIRQTRQSYQTYERHCRFHE